MFGSKPAPTDGRARRWPLIAIAAPAFVATWSGWVGLGEKAGFGPVKLLPGIVDGFVINSAITLPLGIEAYAAYALGVWLSSRPMSERTRGFAMVSGITALVLGALGQVAYHLLETFGKRVAPWQIVVGVACLPIAIVGMTAALLHMLRADDDTNQDAPDLLGREPVLPTPTEEAPAVTVMARISAPAVREAPEAPAAVLPPVAPGMLPVVEQEPDREHAQESGGSREQEHQVLPMRSSRSEEEIREFIASWKREHRELPTPDRVKKALGIGATRAKKFVDAAEQEQREQTG
jgi:hypothetical protein